MALKFECPKCSAKPHKHGRGGASKCMEGGSGNCEGLICDCDPMDNPDSEKRDHGISFSNPCTEANCYHCGWGGTIPAKPKEATPWEKRALEEGWTPPAKRAKELGL